MNQSYVDFLTDQPADVILEAYIKELPDLTGWEMVYDSSSVWRIYRKDNAWGITLRSHALGPEPYQVAVFRDDFTSGKIYNRPVGDGDDSNIQFPLNYPLHELIAINLLARGRGVLLHSCAVIDGDHGYLFCGISGGCVA